MTTNHTRSRQPANHYHGDPPRLRAALAAAERGWPVFPLYRNTKKPAVLDWENTATTDHDRIRRWWATAAYNVGVACGPAGIVVLDLDAVHGPLPPHWAALQVTHGRDVLAILAERAGQPDPADTYTVNTPRTPGQHRYYLAPPDRELRNTIGALGNGLGPLIDVRAHGGFIVAAGSMMLINSTPRYYRPHSRRPVILQPLPQWLTEGLTPPPPSPRGLTPRWSLGRKLDNYVRAAVDNEARIVIAAAPGTRAGTVFRSAAALGNLVGAGVLDEHVAEQVLLDAARVHDGVDHWTAREARHHVRNGLTAGKTTPREMTALTA